MLVDSIILCIGNQIGESSRALFSLKDRESLLCLCVIMTLHDEVRLGEDMVAHVAQYSRESSVNKIL